MRNVLSGITKWACVWAPLVTFLGVFFTFRHYCPKPTIQAPPPGVEVRKDADGPFLQVKLRLGNPGASTIYYKSVILKTQGFKKLTAMPNGNSNVPPEQSSPRPPFLRFKAKERLCRKGKRALPDQIRVKLLYRYRSGSWPRTRTLRLSATIRKSDLTRGGMLGA